MIKFKKDQTYRPGYDCKWGDSFQLALKRLVKIGAFKSGTGAIGYRSQRNDDITYVSMMGYSTNRILAKGVTQVVREDDEYIAYGPGEAHPSEIANRLIYEILPDTMAVFLVPCINPPDEIPVANNCCIPGTEEHAEEVGATLTEVRPHIFAAMDNNDGVYIAVMKKADLDTLFELVESLMAVKSQ